MLKTTDILVTANTNTNTNTNTMTVEERILRSYCSPSLAMEYDRMSLADKATLREALMTTLRMRVVNIQAVESRDAPNIVASRDPFAKLLKELLPRIPTFSAKVVEMMKRLLLDWGAIPSNIARYRQVVAMQRKHYSDTREGHHALTTSSNVSKRGSNNNWNSKLREVSYSELVLFQTAKGCYIEGTIVGEAIQPMVGGTTLIQETSGAKRCLMVCFYNVLPDGIRGVEAESLLKYEFPLGATLRVTEPFYKIFGDGSRGIRVDTPRDMHVVVNNKAATTGSNQDGAFLSAQKAKQLGNDFVKKNQYMAAIDMYLKGLRNSSSESDFVATVLSNRSQAYIQLECWTLGLCDAAASLTIRPSSAKTSARYRKCLSEQSLVSHRLIDTDTGSKKKRILFGDILATKQFQVSLSTWNHVDLDKAQTFKKDGNNAFQKQSYKQAIYFYSKALEAYGETTRAMLSNWAFCALSTHNFGDVVATTIASLRIGNNDKALFRLVSALSFLGDYDLAQQTFDKLVPLCNVTTMSTKLRDLENQLERCIKYRRAMIKGKTTSPEDALALTQDTPSCMGNWVHACVETFLTKDKGRGLRATQNLAKGSVVLLEWPLVNKNCDSSTEKDIIVSNTDASTIQTGSSAQLRSMVVNRLKREATLAQIMSHMSDGINTPSLVPVSDLQVNLEMFPFLLPTHREYCNLDTNDDDNGADDDGKKRETIKEITADRVDKILSTNSYGTSETILDDKLCRSELFPTVSMMNHASNPNCTFQKLSLNFLCMVIAYKPIQAGEELTMKYHSDEVVEEKWGIKARN